MSEHIHSEQPTPAVQQTRIEKVLIKHQALAGDKYRKAVIKQSINHANDIYQNAIEQQQDIYQTAFNQGYRDGAKQLLADLIRALDDSEKNYQLRVLQSEQQLSQLLNELFEDSRLQEIIAHYFLQQAETKTPTCLHVPAQIQTQITTAHPNITVCTSANNTIALEVDNHIRYFSAEVAAQKCLPQVFSVSARCQLLAARKQAYQHFIDLLLNEESSDEHINE